MREIRLSGSEGGGGHKPLPTSIDLSPAPPAKFATIATS